MNWGPFESDLGGKPIIDHVVKKIFPIMKKVKNLSLEVSDYKQGFLNSFFRVKLPSLNKQYRAINKEFLEIYHVYQTPDDLFKDLDIDKDKEKEKLGIVMVDYINTKAPVMEHFKEGFHLLELIDRSLIRYSQSADQRVSTFLAILAITISIIVAILK